MPKYFIEKYFPKHVIDDFLKIYVERHPDAIKNWHRAMTDEEAFMTSEGRAVIQANIFEMEAVAKELQFFNDYLAKLLYELMEVSGGGLKAGQVFKFRERLVHIYDYKAKRANEMAYRIAGSEFGNDVGMRLRDML